MAGLWESSGGVFWSTPPDDGLPLLRWTIVLLFAAVAATLVAVRIRKKRSEPEWHLRQHMVEIGSAVTLTYLVGITVLTWGRIGTLGDMPLNEVGDFLAGAFGPVAFLWLVLGFLQQGDELRQGTEALKLQATELKNSVQQQSIMAAAAVDQIEAQREAIQHQLDEKDRALKARFMTGVSRTLLTSGEIQCRVTLQNIGASAYRVFVVFDPPIPGCGTQHIGDVHKTTDTARFSLRFYPEHAKPQGTMTLNYDDSAGNRREEAINYSVEGKALRLDR